MGIDRRKKLLIRVIVVIQVILVVAILTVAGAIGIYVANNKSDADPRIRFISMLSLYSVLILILFIWLKQIDALREAGII